MAERVVYDIDLRGSCRSCGAAFHVRAAKRGRRGRAHERGRVWVTPCLVCRAIGTCELLVEGSRERPAVSQQRAFLEE